MNISRLSVDYMHPPQIAESNRILTRRVIQWLVVFACLPWVIPDHRSDELYALWWVFDFVASHVPAIEKIASVSASKWTTYGYFSASSALFPVVVANLLSGSEITARFRHAFYRAATGPIKMAISVYLLFIPAFVMVFAVLVWLPFELSTDYGPTRGQAYLALMIGTRIGMSLFGPPLFVGLATVGFAMGVFLIGPFASLIFWRRK